MKIADLDLGDKPLLLAPMEDVTDPSFRYMCKRFGPDMVYTEFISSDGLMHEAAKSLRKLNIDDGERPVGIQIYGVFHPDDYEILFQYSSLKSY